MVQILANAVVDFRLDQTFPINASMQVTDRRTNNQTAIIVVITFYIAVSGRPRDSELAVDQPRCRRIAHWSS